MKENRKAGLLQWAEEPLENLLIPRRELVTPSATGENRYVGLEHLDSGLARIYRFGSDSMVRSSKARFYAGDILYGKLRPYLDKGAIAEWPGVCSTDILVFEVNKAKADPLFMGFFIHQNEFVEYAVANTDGVNHPRTSWSSLSKYRQKIPTVREQVVISRLLSRIQSAIEIQDKAILLQRDLKTATMEKLFRGGFSKTPAHTQETPFGPVPSSWKIKVLSECAYIQTGLAKGKKINCETTTRPYLRVANVQDGYLDLSEIKFITVAVSEVAKFLLQDGDVLLTEGGDFDKLGRGFIWRNQIPDCIHQNHIFSVRTNRKIVLPEFLTYLVQSPYGKAYFLKVAHKTTNLACINSQKLKELPVLLPELPEQLEIASILQKIDERIENSNAKRVCLRKIFSVLLHQLLSGEIKLSDALLHFEKEVCHV